MRLSRNQARAVYAGLIIIACFIPAYGPVSAIRFLQLAIGGVRSDNDLTVLDLVVVLIPLMLIPTTAIIVLIWSLKNKPFDSLLLGLPFFSLSFFFIILSFDVNRQAVGGNVFSLLFKMNVGFYVALVASLLLLLSYSRREYLNLGSGRR